MSYLVGLIIGGVLGLTGAGGSVFAVPLLMWLLGLSAQQAMGISLGAVAISAAFGTVTKLKSGLIEWLPATVFLLIGSALAPVGAWLNRRADDQWLMVGFTVLVVIVAAKLWCQTQRDPSSTRYVRTAAPDQHEGNAPVCVLNEKKPYKVGLRCFVGMSSAAMLTGLLSGLFGVGGGFMIVPALMLLTNVTIQQAVATSLLVISVISTTGFVSFLQYGDHVSVPLLLEVMVGGILGMIFGIYSSKYLAGPTLQKLFSILMVMIAIATLVKVFM